MPISPSRRGFLGSLAAAATALVARPAPAGAAAPGQTPPLPAIPASGRLDEAFWRSLRPQFLIPPDEAFFNTGTLGSQPRVVLDAVTRHMTHVVRDVAHWDYKAQNEQYFTGYAPETGVRQKLAALINAHVDEVALTQNATMAMSFVANGVDLGPGDEVIVMQNAHTGGRGGWELRGKRYGAHVRYVAPPAPARTPEQLVALFENATTPQTRVWAIPHLTSGSGAILFPVQEMCRRARERGILTVIDGAQTLGHLRIDVKAMGCDAFFSSPHKWLLAPVGTGMLYIRRELHERVWATLASGQWDNHRDGLYRLMQYGTGNLSLLVGLEQAIDFYQQLGPARVEERILGLANRLRAGLTEIRGAFIRSPQHPALVSATTIWGLEGVTGERLQDELWRLGKIRVRRNGDGVRHCCHIYNLESDVDRALETARRIAAAG
jgi:selenocysteine lyase/cysteine desulfurase